MCQGPAGRKKSPNGGPPHFRAFKNDGSNSDSPLKGRNCNMVHYFLGGGELVLTLTHIENARVLGGTGHQGQRRPLPAAPGLIEGGFRVM